MTCLDNTGNLKKKGLEMPYHLLAGDVPSSSD